MPRVGEGRIVEIEFGPFIAQFLNGRLVAFRAGLGRVRSYPTPMRMLGILAARHDTWVRTDTLHTVLYAARQKRHRSRILDVNACLIRGAITKAFVWDMPQDLHYLVGDRWGHFGLFSTLRPMGNLPGSHRPLGVHLEC